MAVIGGMQRSVFTVIIIIINSKYFAVSDWLKSSAWFFLNQPVLTKFGRCQQCTINSKVYLLGNEFKRWFNFESKDQLTKKKDRILISNGNRTEWSPIRSVTIPVINKIGRPRSGSPICLTTSMITDRIGRHEVLLPINHNFNKICDIIAYFLNQSTRNSKFCFASSEKKKPFKRARDGAYCPIT